MAGSSRRNGGGLRVSTATVVALLAALIVAGIGGWQIARSRDVELANAGVEARNLANALAQHAARTIEGVDLILSGTIERLSGDPERATMTAFLQRRAATLPQVHKLQVMSADGTWAYASVPLQESQTSADRDYFLWHRDHADQGTHLDLPIVSRHGGVAVLPVSRRLETPDGRFDGAVSATVFLDFFRSFYTQLDIGQRGAIGLWTDAGKLLVRAPDVVGTRGRDISAGRLFKTELQKASAGAFHLDASGVDGVERIVGFRRLDRYPVVATASLAVEDVLANWRREALIQGFVLTLATAALLALAAAIERRSRRASKSERAAEEAQTLFRGLFENSTDCLFVYVAEADGGFRLEAWNAAAAQATGLRAGEAEGRKVEDLMPPAHAAKVRAELSHAIAAGHPVRTEDDEVIGGGTRSWEVVHVPLRDHAGDRFERVFVAVRDITHLKRAEAEAHEANRLLVMAEQVSHVGHWRLTVPAMVLTWSEEVYRIHGVAPETFVPTAETAISAYHPEDRPGIEAAVQGALHGGKDFEVQFRILRPGGEIRHVFARGVRETLVNPEDGTETLRAVFGVFGDLTDAKQAERALAEKSALFEATLQSMDQGLLMIAADGTVPVSNDRARELLGLSPDLMRERPSYRAVRDHLRASGSWGEAIQDPKRWRLDGERRTTELRSERRRADGSIIEIRSLPMRTGEGYVQTLTDITERRRAEEGLRDSEARYRLLADHTSDLIVLGTVEGNHSYVSPAVTSMLGYSVEEVTALGLRTRVHPEDMGKLTAALQALDAQAPTGSAIFRLRHKAGHDVWVEAAFRRVEENGEVQIIKALRDVTMRQRQAVHLERARAAAEAGARVKSEFLANMSHELRTPLTGMLGVHDLLRSDASLTESQSRLVGLAQESGRSLLTIVNDILDFSKIEAGQLTIDALPFGLRSLVEGCRELTGEAARARGLALATEIAPDLPDWLIGDPARLRQVLLNLVTNAIKFTPSGTVSVRAAWLALPGRRPRLRVEVIDTGIGIAADKLPKLFERFSQADGSISRHYGGTGLGLAISRRLVQLMGGELGVTSTLGTGSTFWFELPLALAQAQGPDRPLRGALAAPAPRVWNLLLAEDNPINQEIIATVLRQKGHAVTLVGDGAAAVAAVRAGPAFDVVLMDVQMPGQDGLAATAAIREWERAEGRRRTPITALTANALAEEVERCRAAGMDAHVAKPVDWADLFGTVERLLAEGAPGPAAAGPVVLDEAMLDMLAGILGTQRIPALLAAFSEEIHRRIARISTPNATAADLSTEAHAMVSLAGQLGFAELAGLCSELEAETDRAAAAARISELAAAADRAVEAASRSPYARAA